MWAMATASLSGLGRFSCFFLQKIIAWVGTIVVWWGQQRHGLRKPGGSDYTKPWPVQQSNL